MILLKLRLKFHQLLYNICSSWFFFFSKTGFPQMSTYCVWQVCLLIHIYCIWFRCVLSLFQSLGPLSSCTYLKCVKCTKSFTSPSITLWNGYYYYHHFIDEKLSDRTIKWLKFSISSAKMGFEYMNLSTILGFI